MLGLEAIPLCLSLQQMTATRCACSNFKAVAREKKPYWVAFHVCLHHIIEWKVLRCSISPFDTICSDQGPVVGLFGVHLEPGRTGMFDSLRPIGFSIAAAAPIQFHFVSVLAHHIYVSVKWNMQCTLRLQNSTWWNVVCALQDNF